MLKKKKLLLLISLIAFDINSWRAVDYGSFIQNLHETKYLQEQNRMECLTPEGNFNPTISNSPKHPNGPPSHYAIP